MTLTGDGLKLVVAVIALGGIVVGGLVAGGFALLTGWLDSRREHRRWLRERRMDAYCLFMLDMSAIDAITTDFKAAVSASPPDVDRLEALRGKTKEFRESLPKSVESVSLLGPRKVNKAGQEWTWALLDYMSTRGDAEQEALSAARWNFLVVAGKVLKSRNVGLDPLVRAVR